MASGASSKSNSSDTNGGGSLCAATVAIRASIIGPSRSSRSAGKRNHCTNLIFKIELSVEFKGGRGSIFFHENVHQPHIQMRLNPSRPRLDAISDMGSIRGRVTNFMAIDTTSRTWVGCSHLRLWVRGGGCWGVFLSHYFWSDQIHVKFHEFFTSPHIHCTRTADGADEARRKRRRPDNERVAMMPPGLLICAGSAVSINITSVNSRISRLFKYFWKTSRTHPIMIRDPAGIKSAAP
jgi:hypothetical protein